MGEISKELPRDTDDSHSGLIVTKKDLRLQYMGNQSVTLVERAERRIAYEVKCHELNQ